MLSRSKIVFLWCLAISTSSRGQAPDVLYLFPGHVTAGVATEVELVGKQIDTIDRLYLARPEIEARLIGKGKAELAVSPDVPRGDCDAWAVSAKGLSSPVRLAISPLPTRIEAEPNNRIAQAQAIQLPAVVCGRVEPGTDSDWCRVTLQAGDGLTLACRSMSLGGTLWPTLVVIDPDGREIAHDTLTQFEPTVHVRAATSGEYAIGIQDRSYRSTAAPFYQLTLTTGPWIVTAYPPTLEKGKRQRVTLSGYNLAPGEATASAGEPLQRRSVELQAPEDADALGGSVLSRALFVNAFEHFPADAGGSVRLELLDRPVTDAAAKAPGGGEPAAMRLQLPADVVNHFATPREVVHWYRFTAQAGRTYWLEAVAERLDRPCDLELIIHDAQGKPLEALNNFTTPKELATVLSLESRDPAGAWKAPADGEYQLAVRDLLATSEQTLARAYRLSVGSRSEDIRVVAYLADASLGWSISAGGKLAVSLTVVRRGGHEGPIEVRAEGLPESLKAAATTIAAGQSTGILTLEADPSAQPWLGLLRLVATTEANQKPLTVSVRTMTRGTGGTPPMLRLSDRAVIAVLEQPKK